MFSSFDLMDCSIPGFPVLYYLPEFLRFMSTELEVLFNHLILCHPLLLSSSIFSRIRVFSNELVLCIRWPKFWSFSISPSSEHSGLISFRIDWFDFLAIQGTLKHPHHNLKASVLQCSAFSMVLFLYPYMTTGKTITLRRQLWHFLAKWCLCFLICCLGLS